MRNSDTSDIPSHFENDAADIKIEFCLANVDPEGNTTDGIDRVNMGASGSWSDNWKPQTIWNPDQYLNIWVADLNSGALGYATLPGQAGPGEDGVVIGYRYFGRAPANPFNNNFNLGRTTTHEVGHWLGLFHIFQEGCAGTSQSTCQTNGDKICDTPPTQSSNNGCPSFSQNTCTETPVDKKDMWMNYMDYVDDRCMYMFTKGQKDVMRGVLNTSRSSILTSSACTVPDYFSYSGQVIHSGTGEGIPNAKVIFKSSLGDIELTTTSNGYFNAANFRAATYQVYVGKWGYRTTAYDTALAIDSLSSSITIPIDSGVYYDDFLMDFGWQVTGNAQTGIWEKDNPISTTHNGNTSNPGQDIPNDYGKQCLITGNGGGEVGNDDVDEGNTVVTSPVFDLSDYQKPYLHYNRWFYNDGGSSSVDDSLVIYLSNGNESVLIDSAGPGTNGNNQWKSRSYRVDEHIALTNQMELSVHISDMPGTGHLVEGAFDGFQVVDSARNTSVQKSSAHKDIRVYPNPASEMIRIEGRIGFDSHESVQVSLVNLQGKVLEENKMGGGDDGYIMTNMSIAQYPHGLYLLHITSGRETTVKRVSIMK